MRAIEGEPARLPAGVEDSQRATTSSAVARSGPILAPRGLAIPERKSRWAPPSWRVRSPTHRRWAEVSYHWPRQGVLPGHGLLPAEDQRLVAGPEVDLVEGLLAGARSIPQARMNRRARSISPAMAS